MNCCAARHNSPCKKLKAQLPSYDKSTQNKALSTGHNDIRTNAGAMSIANGNLSFGNKDAISMICGRLLHLTPTIIMESCHDFVEEELYDREYWIAPLGSCHKGY